MIETITSSAVFTTSGASLTGHFQPEKGLTAVVGENGQGKTFLTIETVRWLLYGKAALRGAATDYKQANASGTFIIRDARYSISRGKQEWIKDSTGDKIAVGAEETTKKVIELMGYGLDVFDLCNAATQGNVQRLGQMRPGERKAIIDKVLRLTDSERAEKDCRDEAKKLRMEAEALGKVLRAPGDAPQPPENYTLSTTLRATIARERRVADEAAALRARRRELVPPVKPVVEEFSEEAIEKLQSFIDEQRQLETRRAALETAARKHTWTVEELDKAEVRLNEIKARKERGFPPVTDEAEIARQWQLHHAFDAYVASEEVTCPKCEHTFRPTGEPPIQPSITKEWLRAEERAHERWKGFDPDAPLPEGHDIPHATQLEARGAAKAREELETLEPPMAAGVVQARLNKMRADKAALEAYTLGLAAYETAKASQEGIQRELDALGTTLTSDELNELYEALSRSERYERDCQEYDALKAAWEKGQAEIGEALRMAGEYKAGADNVVEARSVLKAMLAPRISKIASSLIYDMSLGKLTSMTVTEDMDVLVGNQKLETLSGAGATVANLALRIAMGQALVARAFPVFLADEIDGDLSLSRRAATLSAMVSLKKHLKQIILVTHRGVDVADHVFDLN